VQIGWLLIKKFRFNYNLVRNDKNEKDCPFGQSFFMFFDFFKLF
jgi:hypothetical protein